MDHSAASGPGLMMLVDNPLLILAVIFGVGGWFVYWLSSRPATSGDSETQSENSANSRGA